MRVRLLGPVDVLVDGTPRPVRGLRRKAVLAALALVPGEIVSTDRLVDIVWGDGAPATAANTLQSHVSHLRRILGERAAIVVRTRGYVLDVGVEATDVQAAQRLIRQGTQSADLAERETRLQAAVELWRGRPLADLTELAWFDDHVRRLENLLLQARHSLVDTRLALGQHGELVPELETLSRQYPLDEQIHRQLILALYRAGRQGDALAAYQQLRRKLGEDLGIDPSQPLRDLETAILRQDTALDAPPAPSVAIASAAPAQLPPAVTGFTGRGRELVHLDSLLPDVHDGGPARPTAVVIAAISGTAGIGKTALATHWAHRVAPWFPDGQLYVNLRGFDPGGSVVDPAEAVRGFLAALGVPVARIPAGPDAQVGLYRSLLAGKRVLVVLDNARDVEQVRPLLPGSVGCMVIVTSRNQLTPLVAAEGAHPVTLDLLTAAEARDLLVNRLGADRVAAEPAAVDDIVARCARLPLALAVVAARAATNPGFPLAGVVAELRQSTGSLDALHGGDLATDVRAVFSWSYRTLSTDAARLFRLLGMHVGPDLTAPAVASLAAVAPRQARVLLAELTRAHLLTEHVPGRYTFHDLLRAYAADLGYGTDAPEQRHDAVHRLLDHYLHTAHTAALLLEPARSPTTVNAPRPGVTPERPGDHEQALAWFTAEHAVLLAAVDQAAATGFDTHAWQLAWTLDDFLDRRGYWHDWTVTSRAALSAAQRLGDLPMQARAACFHARACSRLGRFDEAHVQMGYALELYGRAHDPAGRAHTHFSLAHVWAQQGRYPQALDQARQALDLYRELGDRRGQALALNSAGWYHANLGSHREALAACRQALVLFEEFGDVSGQAATWDSIGYAHHHLGEYTQAVTCYQRSFDLYRHLGNRYEEASTLTRLGDSHQAARNPDAARTVWRQALDTLEKLEHLDADQLRAKLDSLGGTDRKRTTATAAMASRDLVTYRNETPCARGRASE